MHSAHQHHQLQFNMLCVLYHFIVSSLSPLPLLLLPPSPPPNHTPNDSEHPKSGFPLFGNWIATGQMYKIHAEATTLLTDRRQACMNAVGSFGDSMDRAPRMVFMNNIIKCVCIVFARRQPSSLVEFTPALINIKFTFPIELIVSVGSVCDVSGCAFFHPWMKWNE